MNRAEALAIAEDLITRLDQSRPTVKGPFGITAEGTSLAARVTEILNVAEFLVREFEPPVFSDD